MAGNDDLQRLLDAGVAAAKRGDRTTGRQLLEQAIEIDPNNELAWIWLASCVNTARERRECLERVLEINPNNKRAQEALQQLGLGSGTVSDRDRERVEQVRRAQRSAPPPRPTTPSPAQQAQRGVSARNLLVVVLVLVAVGAGFFILSQLTGADTPPPTQPVALAPTTLAPPTNTPTPLPTRTPNPFTGTRTGPTLPPTFTATLPPTNTPPPPPTETPYPVENFVVLYTSLEDGASQPNLYRMTGAGTDETLVGNGFRDVEFDPSGRRIAFIRDVDYEIDGAPVSLPELFIADVDDLENPTQLTEMQANSVNSPTWSPTGGELVFVSDFAGTDDLWFVSITGENLRNLTADEFTNRDPAWEPIAGSNRIVFASDRISIGRTELFSFNIPSVGEEPEYTRMTTAVNNSYAPAWSPNGERITFVSDRTVDADIYVMDADGSGETLLTIDDGGAEDRSPTFTPDNRWVVFISNRDGENFQTYMVSLRGDVLVRLTNSDRNDTSISFRPEAELRFGG